MVRSLSQIALAVLAVFALAFPAGGAPVEVEKGAGLLLIVNEQGEVRAPNREQPLVRIQEIKKYLQEEFEKLKRESSDGKASAVIRARRDAPFGMVFDLMEACKEAGFTSVQFRAVPENATLLEIRMNAKGELVVPGEKPLATKEAKEKYLKDKIEQMKKRFGEDQIALHLFASELVKYDQVYELLRLCKELGVKKLQLRAIDKD